MNKTQTATTKEGSNGFFIIDNVEYIIYKEEDYGLNELIKKNILKMSRHVERMEKLGNKELKIINQHTGKENYKKIRDELLKLYDKYLKCIIVILKCYEKIEEIEQTKKAKIGINKKIKEQLEARYKRIEGKQKDYFFNKIFNE